MSKSSLPAAAAPRKRIKLQLRGAGRQRRTRSIAVLIGFAGLAVLASILVHLVTP